MPSDGSWSLAGKRAVPMRLRDDLVLSGCFYPMVSNQDKLA